jgi:TatD DNase family protein
MIDVHCHLQFKAFEQDFEAVATEAFESGVATIINVGTQLSSSQKAVEFANTYDNMYAIVGVHPHHADKIELNRHSGSVQNPDSGVAPVSTGTPQNDNVWIEELERLATKPKVVAIGEIGLDNYRYQSNGIVDPATQKEIFIAQLELAHRVGLPIQIHNRHAGLEILEILESHKHLLQGIPGMFHCFAGNKDILHRALALGFCIGFDGNTTYKGLAPGEDTLLSDIAKETPMDRMVCETDSPYLPPQPYRGRRNTPKNVIITGKFLAHLKGISFEEFDAQTTKNVLRMFQLNARR